MIRVQVTTAELVAGVLRLEGPEHHYLMRVRRARVGERIELFDGAGGSAEGVIQSIDGDAAMMQVAATKMQPPPRAQLTAIIPLIKGERMDQLVEKLVEVGCDRLILWEAGRSVVRLERAKRAGRIERIRTQVAAAVRQCGRSTIPTVEGIWALSEVVALGGSTRKIALAPATPRLVPGIRQRTDGAESTTVEAEAGADTGSGEQQSVGGVGGESYSVSMISGPEGGFTPEELNVLVASGFELGSLTDTVLRAETAPVIAIALWRWAEV